MRSFQTDIDGKTLRGLVHKAGGRLWIHLNGRTFVYEPEASKRRHRSEIGKAQPGEVLAPMPGKVTKVEVNVGDSVALGQVLVVLEAMKMEYTLKAEVVGVIAKVNVQAGEQVALGKLLVELTPKGEE